MVKSAERVHKATASPPQSPTAHVYASGDLTHSSEPAVFYAGVEIARRLRSQATSADDLAALLRPHLDDLNANHGANCSDAHLSRMERKISAHVWNHGARSREEFISTGTMRAEYGPEKWRTLTDVERCTLAAKRTNTQQRTAMEAKIREAVATLRREGRKVTMTAVAELVDTTRTNITMNYKDLFQELKG